MNLANINKILIIQTAFIGDVVLTTPLIESLLSAMPGVKIDFLTIPKSFSIISSNPGIHSAIIFDKKGKDKGILGLWRMGKSLRKNNYDLCVVPHRSFRSAILAHLTQATVRIGFDRSAWKSAFTDIVPYKEELHEIERNLSLLTAIQIYSPLVPPFIYSSDEDKVFINKLWLNLGFKGEGSVIAIAPGSVWATKCWPEEYYIKLCRLLREDGFKPILIGSKEDSVLCEKIAKQSGDTPSIAGTSSLTQSYEFLKLCAGLVTNDSAPLHLGMGANIPVFAIFGPTVPDFGFAPFGEKSVVFEKENLACRPCGIHGGNKCPVKTFECMWSLKPSQLVTTIRDFYTE